MWDYFKIELLQFFTNKKNIAIYVVLLAVTLFYSFRLAPAYDPIEKVDYDEIEARFLTQDDFIQNFNKRRIESNAHPSVLYAINVFLSINPHDRKRLTALEQEDYQTYAIETAEWYKKTLHIIDGEYFFYNPRYYSFGNSFSHMDGYYGYSSAYTRYTAYREADYKLNLNVFDGRTAFQTAERLLVGPLPLILFIAGLFLIVDIVTKDRRNKTLLRGYPISDWKKLIVKAVVSATGMLALFVPLLVGFVIIGIQFGFGNLQLPVVHYNWTSHLQETFAFEVMPMGEFLLKTFGLLAAWFALIIAIVLLFSVVIYQEMINLVVGLAIIFGEFIYYNRAAGKLWDVQDIPLTYSQVGQVVTGLRKFNYESPFIEYSTGLQLVGGTALICIVLTLLIIMNKRFKIVR